MKKFTLMPVGVFVSRRGEFKVRISQSFRPCLKELEEFSHVQIVWWFSESDNESCRYSLVEEKPYRDSPEEVGVFATRSPDRPNPIAVSVAEIISVDIDGCEISLTYHDAFDGTPVLDLKPYIPSADRVMDCRVPEWCSSWPSSFEESGDFDWSSVFNFQTARNPQNGKNS